MRRWIREAYLQKTDIDENLPESSTTSAAKAGNDDVSNPVKITKDGEFHVASSSKRKYLIEYQRDACIGASSCAAIAPATFEMDDENRAFIIEEGDWDEEELILAAAQSCPVFAIVIKDLETGEQIFPEL